MQEQNNTVPVRIYTLNDPDTNEVRYVGKTQQRSTNRFLKHIKDATTGKRYRVSRWIRALLQAGRKPVENTIEIVSCSEWRIAERKWIAYYREQGARLTNLTDGGDGTSGWVMSEQTRQLLSRLGSAITNETRAKRSASLKGRVISATQRAIISDVQRSRKHEPCSSETKEKIGTANKGNQNALGASRSAETRKRMSQSQLARNLFDSKALIPDESVRALRERYAYTEATMDELAEEFKVSAGTVYRLVRGTSRSDAGGPICTEKHRKQQIKCRGKTYRRRRKNTVPMSFPAGSPHANGSD